MFAVMLYYFIQFYLKLLVQMSDITDAVTSGEGDLSKRLRFIKRGGMSLRQFHSK